MAPARLCLPKTTPEREREGVRAGIRIKSSPSLLYKRRGLRKAPPFVKEARGILSLPVVSFMPILALMPPSRRGKGKPGKGLGFRSPLPWEGRGVGGVRFKKGALERVEGEVKIDF